MDRRLFLSGLAGALGTTAIASVIPRPAKALALAAAPAEIAAPQSDILPKLDLPDLDLDEAPADTDETLEDNIQLAYHEGRRHRRRRRRRRRVRRWRRVCRRYWDGWWRRRCRRRPFWIWIWIG